MKLPYDNTTTQEYGAHYKITKTNSVATGVATSSYTINIYYSYTMDQSLVFYSGNPRHHVGISLKILPVNMT